MRAFWRRWKRMRHGPGIEEARRAREAAGERLETAQREVIAPLREMRAANHISEDISKLIRRRVGREDGEP